MATRYEHYITGDDQAGTAYDDYWQGQTFTPSVGHTIKSVKLLLYRVGSPGTITVSIRATDGGGLPTGNDLCSGTTNGDLITDGTDGEWIEITLGAGDELEADETYAIIIRALDGDVSNSILWRVDGSSPSYAGGSDVYSGNGGEDWTAYTGYDYMFEEWGDPSLTIHEVDVSETLSLTGSIVKLNDLRHAESLSLTESLIKLNDLRHTDTLTLVEAMSIYKIVNVIVSEVLSLTDNIIKTIDKRFTETLTLTESIPKLISKLFTESVSITESIVKLFDRRFTDTITITDVAYKLMDLVLSETLHIVDCVIRWRWLTAIRNLASGRCPRPSIREQTKIDDGLTGE